MKIVDPHHHLWDLQSNYYPWLTDHITPRVCGDYAAIRHNYLISDFRRDLDGLEVVASVHIQAEHDPRDPVRETSWLQSIADDRDKSAGFPHGIVAYADLSAPNVERTLEEHRCFANTRGIRQSLNGILNDPNTNKDLLQDPVWRSNLALVGRLGLSFDLQLYPQQIAMALPLLRANTDMQFILCHTGLPADQSPEGATTWRSAMRELALYGNVAVKISGFGMFDRTWTRESIRPFVREVIEIFGTERCMFASNFPVDGMATGYHDIWSAFDNITSDLLPAERNALFCQNACRFYKLSLPENPATVSERRTAWLATQY